ncbi:MAG: gliding motility-associated C-terminal domain-containing protein, partial [Bacteroidetes bacterium]|nr:gliding motility-associated C-terminal domain-containing protein [Bacteroidota bacterium]
IGSNGGCSSTATVSILVNNGPTLTLAASPSSICIGSTSTLTASGAISYTWNPGAILSASTIVSPATSTNYTLTGSDVMGCTNSQTLLLTVSPIPTVNVSSATPTICSGNNATLTASGAISYTWNPGALTGSNVTVSPSITTVYTVSGSSLGCAGQTQYTLTVNPSPTLVSIASPTSVCIGSSATLTASGATSYTWNPGALTGSNVSVTPFTTTTYTVIGTNGLCTKSSTLLLTVNFFPVLNITASPSLICGSGNSTLIATGANSYTWNPGATTGSIDIVTPPSTTIYTLIGLASTGCSNSKTFTLTVNPSPTVTASANPTVLCSGNTSTLLSFGASTYTWMPGSITGSQVSVTPTISTIYTVTGNSLGCNSSATVNVVVNPTPSINVVASSTNICIGNTVTLNASGASTFTWFPSVVSSPSITESPTLVTTYTVFGSSAAGCTNSTAITVSVSPNPTVLATASPTSICNGQSATLSAMGASSYTWNPGALTSASVTVLPAISTTYTVTGKSGICSSTNTVNIVVNSLPTITAVSSPTSICPSATANISASGAVSYTWLPMSTSGTNIVVSPTISSTYTVIGTNSAGCTSSKTIQLVVNPNPSVTAISNPTAICSGSSATLVGTAIGGGPFTSTWTPLGSVGNSITVSPTINSTYTWNVTNSFGCTASTSVNVTVNPTPTIVLSALNITLCSGASTMVTASGATSYTWNPGGLIGASQTLTAITSTIYTIIGSNGFCTSTQSLSLTVIPSPSITISATSTSLCSGQTSMLSASGALNYTWMPGSITGSSTVISPNTSTTYTVIGDNGLGCVSSSTMLINVTPTPTLTISPNATLCAGDSYTLSASGATTYTWLPINITTSITIVTPTTTVTYTLLGSNGACTDSAFVTVFVNPSPTLTTSTTSASICAGGNVTLTAAGATSYTWMPVALSGSLITDTPSSNTIYTVIATNSLGCFGTSTIGITVNPPPVFNIIPSNTLICLGSTGTLSAIGASNYTWMPIGINGSSITITPSVSTIYTVTADNGIAGCSATQTININVLSTPTITANSNPTVVCAGTSVSLTASGALTYTWLPIAITGSAVTDSPTTTLQYTVNGSNGSCGTTSAVITVTVNALPSVTASASGSISCTSPSVNLIGVSTSTNVSYNWNGPFTYSSSAQSPSAITIPGNYTLTVTDLVSLCSNIATTSILSSTNIPSTTITVSGSITCNSPNVTVTAVTSATNASYAWAGPASFTNSTNNFTTAIAGNYSLVVTDITLNCPASTIITIYSNTTVPITASIIPATCSGQTANNNGSIIVSGFGIGDNYDFVSGTSYTGTASYATAPAIPMGGVITNTLNNPLIPTPYTIRFFDANGCTKDTTLYLLPTSCVTNTIFGVAKAVSTPTLLSNGTYSVQYKITAKNYGSSPLNNVVLNENLNTTFPLPTTYTLNGAPVITTPGASLIINPSFNGSTQTLLTNTITSAMAGGEVDTITFNISITANGYFGAFKNTVLGVAQVSAGVIVADSSQTGLDPAPGGDGNPSIHNQPTILNLTPQESFGITKQGFLSQKLQDGSYDMSYTLTIYNMGNDTLRNVKLKDSLFNNTIKHPATYTIKSGPFAVGTISANTSFNGDSDINLIVPAQSKLAPFTSALVTFTVNVFPDTVTVYSNTASGSAVTSQSITLNNTSNNGITPNAVTNGTMAIPSDNLPTILVISSHTLFVPQGFSPNGDGKNDYWVIQGLPTGNTVKIYNRWGSLVYQKTDYDNTWGATSNVSGALGTGKVPQGTYYYIIEFSDQSNKPIYGFIVIEY